MLHEQSASNEICCASPLDLAITSQIHQGLNKGKISSGRSTSKRVLPGFLFMDGNVLASPEYVAKKGNGGGTIDFLVPAKG